MPAAPVFPPLIVRTKYQPDGSSKAGFLNLVRDMAMEGKQQFERAFGEIDQIIAKSMAGARGGSFQFDIPGLRKTAADADHALARLTAMRDAAMRLARQTGDTSSETVKHAQALQAQVREAELAKRAADAQVVTYSRLQDEIDRAVASNERLRQSYRDTYAEQARAENLAFRSQRDINSLVAPGLTSRATDNGAGYAALAQLAKDQDEAARAMERYRAEAASLRQALDPAIAVQQRFDAEIERASQLLRAGAISTREYAAATTLARENLQTGWAALTRSQQQTADTTQRSFAAMRMASIGAGQQLQDIAISLYSGQRASVVLAQQLPQLGFALSSLEGNSNKTLATLGKFGVLASGPWGIGIAAAGAALGYLVTEMLDLDAKTKKTEKTSRDFLDVMRDSKASWDDVAKAARDYADAQEKGRQVTLLTIQAEAAATAERLKAAISIREKLAADLEAYESITRRGAQSVAGDVARQGAFARADAVRGKITENEAKLKSLQAAAGEVVIKAADAIAGIRSDPLERIKSGFDVLRDSARKSITDIEKLTQRLEELNRQQKAAEDAYRASERAERRSTTARPTADFISPVTGATVTGRFKEARGGRQHEGVDLAVPVGTPVKAPAGGVIIEAGRLGNYGNVIFIDHGAGTISRLAHLSEIDAVKGQVVSQGDVVGLSGGARGAPGSGNSRGPHLHQEVRVNGRPVDPLAGRFATDEAKVAQAAEKIADQMARLSEFASDAAARVDGIAQGFADTPTAIARANAAMAQLNDLADDIGQRVREGLDPKIADELRAAIERAGAAVQGSLDKPFRDMLAASREEAEVQELLIRGRTVDAEVLQRSLSLKDQMRTLSDEELGALRAAVVEERLRTAELERRNQVREREAQLVDDTRDNLRQSLQDIARGGGIGSVGQLFRRQFDLVRQNAVDSLFDDLFGDFFTSSRDRALGFDKVKEASERQVDTIDRVRSALDRLAISANAAADLPTGGSVLKPAAAGPLEAAFDAAFAHRLAARIANDNAVPTAGEILVQRSRDPRQFLGDLVGKVADVFLDERTAKKIGEGITDGLGRGNGAAYGMLASGLAFGGGGSPLLSALGGGIGEKLLQKPLEKGLESIAKGLGDFAGPLGSIAGGLIGGAIGSLLTSTPRASATIGGGAGGSLEVVSTRGNSKSLRDASSKSANEALDSIEAIAEAFGATIDPSRGSVSLGYRKGNARVDPTGSGITKTKRGAIDFGEDTAAAIKFATLDLIKDGVLNGLRASTQRILQQGSDLDRAIQKALDFESVFDRLKDFRDPVGAAIDGVDKEFGRLKKIFGEAGASAAELADLEALYSFERADAVKSATERVTGSLKGLLEGLTTGDTGLSLRERLANAQATYSPLADRVRAGDRTAYDDFAAAGETLRDLTRQIYGSQSEYFDFFDDLKSLTTTALQRETDLADTAANRDSPFSNSAVPANDNAGVVSAINNQTDALLSGLGSHLDALNANLGALLEQGKANGTTGYPAFSFPTFF